LARMDTLSQIVAFCAKHQLQSMTVLQGMPVGKGGRAPCGGGGSLLPRVLIAHQI
jgi:hypothetical protein